MCGITGYSTLKGAKLGAVARQKRANIAKGLLIANESRGIDSTGVFLQNGKYHVLSKNTCHATKFVREKDVIKLFEKDSYLMLGHTRQATTGIVSKQNAHPFIKGNIVGVHNGIISNDDDVAKENKFKFNVDSEVIFQLLSKNKNNFVKTFKEIKGSASLAWINKL
ncbi:MAG: class II glutamine amidotransferase, partial [Nanoarchaeota archaeon]